MAIAQGISKSVRLKKQSALGTIASGSGAQELRRVISSLDLEKETYESQEIVSHAQVLDYRHGMRRVRGEIAGELSPGSYNLLMQSVLRKDFVAGATTTAIITVTAAAGPPGTFTRSSGSFITDGFKVGDVMNWSGWASPATANNAKNYIITALSATVMTVDGTVVARAAGDSVTGVVVGKKSLIPTSGHTKDYYTFEHWFADIAKSEAFKDCVIGSMTVRLPATGLATVSFNVLGRDIVTAGSQNFTSPTAASTTGIAGAVNGALLVDEVVVAVLTGLEFTLDIGLSDAAVVGSRLSPDIFVGRSRVTGSFTAFFESETLRDLFINETEAAIVAAFYLSNAANAGFLAFNLPRIKVGGARKDDGDKGIVQTFPFQALRNSAGGSGQNTDDTTLSVQDSTI